MGELGIGYRPNEENVLIVAYTFSELQLFHEKGANNYTDLFLGNGVKVTYLHSADGYSYLKISSKLGWGKRQWEKFFSMTTRAELALENDLRFTLNEELFKDSRVNNSRDNFKVEFGVATPLYSSPLYQKRKDVEVKHF